MWWWEWPLWGFLAGSTVGLLVANRLFRRFHKQQMVELRTTHELHEAALDLYMESEGLFGDGKEDVH